MRATGQRGVTPSIIVWDSTSAATKCSLKLNKGGRAVSAMAFSSDGALLVAAAQDDEHTVHVYNWAEGLLLNRVAGGRSKVLAFAWSVPGASVSLLQCGVDHYQV